MTSDDNKDPYSPTRGMGTDRISRPGRIAGAAAALIGGAGVGIVGGELLRRTAINENETKLQEAQREILSGEEYPLQHRLSSGASPDAIAAAMAAEEKDRQKLLAARQQAAAAKKSIADLTRPGKRLVIDGLAGVAGLSAVAIALRGGGKKPKDPIRYASEKIDELELSVSAYEMLVIKERESAIIDGRDNGDSPDIQQANADKLQKLLKIFIGDARGEELHRDFMASLPEQSAAVVTGPRR